MPMKQGPPRPRPEPVARPVTNIESIRKVALKLIANFPGKLECATGVDGKTLILCQEKLSPKQKQWIKDEWKRLTEPSSVDRLKADEGAKVQPKAGSAIEELLDACEVLKRQAPEYRTHVGENGYFVSDGQMNRLCQAAFVVQQRRDELPEPMDGHR
ncbi:hypothetical protein LCGC14_1938890 [marine sediment metagenome]|uniref:Uncharacterized protein n=1 Tax=marine sediment metagenome TaxID=412755 RepID=A0A0F9FL58_9ZZZZ